MAVLRPLSLMFAAVLAAGVAGCGGKTDRPAAKPGEIGVKVVQRGATGASLTPARVSTKSGDILILEPDGSVSEIALDSPSGRDAFDVSEAELAALSVNLGLNLSAAPNAVALSKMSAPRSGPTAQQKALEEFAARTQPALPRLPAGFTADPANFIGVAVKPVAGDKRGDLVEVTANLKPGVDADVAFAYATCALAGWAKDNKRGYARHIRTLSDKRDGKLLVGSVFTLSGDKPMGLRVMETRDTLRECKDRGIPAA